MANSARNQAHIRLQQLVDDLGATLLEAITPTESLDTEVTGITIYDPHDELPICPGELVLGVGVATEAEINSLITRLGPAQAAALVIKTPGQPSNEIRDMTRRHGLPLLGLARGASWFHVAVLLQTLLERWPAIDNDPHGNSAVEDLFAFANAVSALVDAPITIEDHTSRVLAYSGRQDEADHERIETVLRRHVPQQARRMLEERGVFRDLARNREPIYVPGFDDNMLPRVAVAIRAGEEILGSLWAVVRQPLPDERMQTFADAAELAALHILRQRSALDLGRRLNADLLQTVLDGGPGAIEAANRLGLRDGPLCVLASQPLGVKGAEFEMDSQRLAISLALHLTAIHPRSAVAGIGGLVYAVISVSGRGTPEQAIRRIQATAADFVSRMGSRAPVVIGIGALVPARLEISRSRAEAERTVRVLRDAKRAGVACYDDVYLETVLNQLGDVLTDEQTQAYGPVARLLDYDAANGTELTPSLSAYLDAFGDVIAAAAAVKVHPNTFRYRLRRIQEIGDIDLSDPRTRLAALVQLSTLRRLE
ncbi:helix-turn-helix domain-containing protein [Microtetraspora malaysiensis]|uniref:helix-turn-helix domain-containing protein n=1 Tax=Microtetraspora malaysiensis TaxID=161358 RepID=UPI003D92B35C